MDLTSLLRLAHQRSASDLHLAVGMAPSLRIDGRLSEMTPQGALIDRSAIMGLIAQALDQPARERLERLGEAEAMLSLPMAADPPLRVRVTACRALAGPTLVLRLLADRPPAAESLGLPPAITALTGRRDGLILIAGAAGAGKTTTAACLIDTINRAGGRHILTVEDPVEFRHAPLGGPVTQREVGTHTASFAAGLTAALRADPDVVLIGEIRDPQTLALALRTAGTGHLVIATLHAASAAGAIDRALDLLSFDGGAPGRDAAREALATALAAVVYQRLLARRGGGRIGLFSLLLASPAVKAAIRDGQTRQLPALMEIGRRLGMLPEADARDALEAEGLVEARCFADQP
ncbi:type IV pilus twitching motility protein PilT [Rhodospirillum rubrum]|uniref:Type II secretion system protein E n=1 Tax=Rhodospirillum rubrum (strain ATCC 11170 / ATH 1.1.1 / DSM 467 / LMG 4362 / NCIMB 8255 / S1) TaxID=269796 RepID=Q2RY72_RHORT|nr:ATPase, T2SS/T4P/T4SS family [Rhodospirillum rubrum]ABC20923.1 type II secretion system protein E [Rhodospirillum rubrum ATCC 11170]AEO46591.1 type II secretion system protein E [Rhodospirillum rubrum F11]MBK5952482.1 type II secretion system protein E [Rhodospirillum rubrum]QXG80621.1 type IV pilus twitching motility protein PilT [Rhodospirillum rubrum]HAP98878.1 type II secretion system protein E [Rhodospirillum rubrum]